MNWIKSFFIAVGLLTGVAVAFAGEFALIAWSPRVSIVLFVVLAVFGITHLVYSAKYKDAAIAPPDGPRSDRNA